MPAPHPLASRLGGRRLVLASGSPRRRELLGSLGIPFDVLAADLDETPRPAEAPEALVARLAAAKAVAVAVALGVPDAVVIGADTVVVLDGEMFGKPGDAAEAARMLAALSGRRHRVLTGIAVALDRTIGGTGVVTSDVVFAELTSDVIDWYVVSGEPLDKAGAYALQGIGAVLVTEVLGSPSSVAGLPLEALTRLLAEIL